MLEKLRAAFMTEKPVAAHFCQSNHLVLIRSITTAHIREERERESFRILHYKL